MDFIGGPSDSEVVGTGRHGTIGERVHGPKPLGWDDDEWAARRHELSGYVLTEIVDERGKYHYRPWGDEPTEHLAWLYGRAANETEWGDMQIMDDSGLVVEYKPGMVRPGKSFGADLGDLTPDEAVELARALLAAADQARR